MTDKMLCTFLTFAPVLTATVNSIHVASYLGRARNTLHELSISVVRARLHFLRCCFLMLSLYMCVASIDVVWRFL